MKRSIEQYKELAKIKHDDKYDYSLICSLPKRDTRVIIICKIHGEFTQSFHKHLCGDGCKKCASERIRVKIINKAKEKFIEQASKLHCYKYDYSKTNYISATCKVIIICPIHSEFYQTPNAHLANGGCRKCSIERLKKSLSIPWDIYKKDLVEIHNDKYDYSNVIWKGVDINIIVSCPNHGQFSIRPASHKRGNGCRICSEEKQIYWNAKNTEDFIKKSIKIWGDDKYDYSETNYVGADKKILIICKKHGKFCQSPSNHYKYEGCQYCHRSYYSPASIKWLEYMEVKHSIKIMHAENEGEYKIPTTRYRVDGYDKNNNTVYEFHGDFWHGNPARYSDETKINAVSGLTYGELYEKTMKKERKIKKLGYNLVVMWESEWKNFIKVIIFIQRKWRAYKKIFY